MAECGKLGRIEFEAQKVHGGGLGIGAALQILVGDRRDRRKIADLQCDAVLDIVKLEQLARAQVRIGIFDQHRRLEIGAVGNQRVVGLEFLGDAGRLEDALDAQHLLNLILHGQAILEDQSHVVADVDDARLLVVEHARAERRAFARVGFEAIEIGVGEFLHDCRCGEIGHGSTRKYTD